jgi:hypothetical protein
MMLIAVANVELVSLAQLLFSGKPPFDLRHPRRDFIAPMSARGSGVLGASQSLSDYLIDFQSAVSELRNRSGRILLHET